MYLTKLDQNRRTGKPRVDILAQLRDDVSILLFASRA